MSESLSLWGLFASSFLAATLLPGGSEAALFALLKAYPGAYWTAITVATVGNTLGGMSSYLVGRLLPAARQDRGLALVTRYGAPALLLAWAPLIGDALCVAAGWLRMQPVAAACFIAIGKLARYLVVAWLAV